MSKFLTAEDSTTLTTPMRASYRAVIVSPHLDDAVFSCAAELMRLRAEGPVLVVNIFTRYGPPTKRRGVVLGDMRYQEEANAAAALGYEFINLGELDASCRRPEYRSLGNIFRPPVPADEPYGEALRLRLLDILQPLSFNTLYVPLGVGWHVDHILTHKALASGIGNSDLLFYEDLPYGLLPNATRLRLGELGTPAPEAIDVRPLYRQNLIPAWRVTLAAYCRTAMMLNLKPKPLQWLALPVMALYLWNLMRRHAREPGSARTGDKLIVPAAAWQPLRRLLPEGGVTAKAHAMMLYESQFREFFSGQADCEQQLRYGSGADGASERFWRRA